MAVGTSYLPSLPLEKFGLEWIQPPLPLAHPLDDGNAAVLERSLEATVLHLARDGASYEQLVRPLLREWAAIEADLLGPVRLPRHPWTAARFGMRALVPAARLARARFQGQAAQALFAGLAGHSVLPLEEVASSAIALVLAGAAHRVGWPIARGGSQAIADAMASYLRSLGGEIETGQAVSSLAALPSARVVLCDTSPQGLAAISDGRLPAGYRRRLENFPRAAGVFKLDWALSAPIPWRAADCVRAGTVHLGGTLHEIAASERAACSGNEPSPRPFVLLSQPSLFDPSRAPQGRHTAWAYCHVPNAWPGDMTAAIEAQVERFAPGFQALILARCARGPRELERHNANLLGGDITGGRNGLMQVLRRPTFRAYHTPLPGIFLCSASTPPGGGVHGLCGWQAARRALRYLKQPG